VSWSEDIRRAVRWAFQQAATRPGQRDQSDDEREAMPPVVYEVNIERRRIIARDRT